MVLKLLLHLFKIQPQVHISISVLYREKKIDYFQAVHSAQEK